MRRSAALLVLAVLASGCDGDTSRDSQAETSTTSTVIVTDGDYAGQWPEDAEALVKQLIPARTVTADIRCGNLDGGRGVCAATWTKPNGAECETEFTFYATGSDLRNAYGGTLAVCTTTRWTSPATIPQLPSLKAGG
jgi:hypothetical protein